MKHLIKSILAAGVMLFGFQSVNAQTYKTSGGILIDVGDGATLAGPHVKHFFSGNNAGEFSLLFGGNTTTIQALYQYNQDFKGANGLMWYVGAGPAISFSNGNSAFSIVPVAGLDYKISGAPIDLFFDWRPRIWISNGYSDFLAGRFGLGARFTF